MAPIYLDYNATSPLRPGVLQAMQPWLEGEFGNPSSTHQAGQRARAALDLVRESIARLINARPAEIIFTSGGSEAINLALLGCAAAHFRLLTSPSEHHAVLRTAHAMSSTQIELFELDHEGRVSWHAPKGGMVSLMLANNETGLVHPIADLARQAREHGALFHCDAVQGLGKLKVDVKAMGVDLLSASAHKFGGPKGVGFLYVGEHARLIPQISGGAQEHGLRGGTENLAGILGMAKALELACADFEGEAGRLKGLRDGLEAALGLRVNSGGAERVSNTLSVLLPGIESGLMIMRLDQMGILASAGSACAAGAEEPSHVLKAMGIPDDQAKCVLRFSLGWGTRAEDIPRAADAVKEAISGFKKAGL
jgi:cysteine desulfurase